MTLEDEDKMERAWTYYEKIRDALNGLFEILSMSLNEDSIFYQFGVDNLVNLKETIIDLLKHDYNPVEIKRKLRDLEFDIKKGLFFDKTQKEI
ncbi:MAG: hypothetical protein ACFE9T_00185 [Promethearchaeota archaeon]